MRGKVAKKLRRTSRIAAKHDATNYIRGLLRGRNFLGRLSVVWRILRCRI